MTSVPRDPPVARPFYLPQHDEVELFTTAHQKKIPVLLKGPTGCGKTRFIEYMSWDLRQSGTGQPEHKNLVTITCHEDMTAADLVGRHLLSPEGTTWMDGPLTQAVRDGSICYLDEVVEARKDTVVIVHSLTDHRRFLPIERLGTTVTAHEDFLLVVSYNPGYQATTKDLKPSTRQRFMAIEFGYPSEQLEADIIEHEARVQRRCAESLASLGSHLRRLEEGDVIEGPSTRLLVYAGALIAAGIPERRACEVSVVQSTTDDHDIQDAVRGLVNATFAA